MKKGMLCLILVLGLPMLLKAETWKGVPMVDGNCYSNVKADPDSHTRECALACAKSGYGLIASDGTFLKFDESGNRKTLDLLRKTDKKDHLRVTVTGTRSGDTIKVEAITFN